MAPPSTGTGHGHRPQASARSWAPPPPPGCQMHSAASMAYLGLHLLSSWGLIPVDCATRPPTACRAKVAQGQAYQLPFSGPSPDLQPRTGSSAGDEKAGICDKEVIRRHSQV